MVGTEGAEAEMVSLFGVPAACSTRTLDSRPPAHKHTGLPFLQVAHTDWRSLTGIDVNFCIGGGTINWTGRGQGSPGSGAVPEMRKGPGLMWGVGVGGELWNREGYWAIGGYESKVLGEGSVGGGTQASGVMERVATRLRPWPRSP